MVLQRRSGRPIWSSNYVTPQRLPAEPISGSHVSDQDVGRLGAGLVDRCRTADRRKLRQSDSDHRRWHAREWPARWRGRSGARILRIPQSAAARHQAHCRGYLGPRLLRAVDQDPRSAVRRPDEGEAQFARGRGAGGNACARCDGAVAEPASGRRRAYCGVRDRQRAGAAAGRRPRGAQARGQRAGTARASWPTAPARTRHVPNCSWSRATRPVVPPSRRATANSRPSCRCGARF